MTPLQDIRVKDYHTFIGPEVPLGQDISWQGFKCTLAQLQSTLWLTPDALPPRCVDAPQRSYMAQYGDGMVVCFNTAEDAPWHGSTVYLLKGPREPRYCQVESWLTVCSHWCEFSRISFTVPPDNPPTHTHTCSANTFSVCSKVNKPSRQIWRCLQVAPIVPKQAPKPDFSNPEVSACQGDMQDSHPHTQAPTCSSTAPSSDTPKRASAGGLRA